MPSGTIGNGPVGAKLWVPTGRLRYPQNLSKPGKFMIGRSETLKENYATKVDISGEKYEELIPSGIKPNKALVAELCRRKGHIDARNGTQPNEKTK